MNLKREDLPASRFSSPDELPGLWRAGTSALLRSSGGGLIGRFRQSGSASDAVLQPKSKPQEAGMENEMHPAGSRA